MRDFKEKRALSTYIWLRYPLVCLYPVEIITAQICCGDSHVKKHSKTEKSATFFIFAT